LLFFVYKPNSVPISFERSEIMKPSTPTLRRSCPDVKSGRSILYSLSANKIGDSYLSAPQIALRDQAALSDVTSDHGLALG